MSYSLIVVRAETLGEAWERAVAKLMENGFDRKVDAPEYQCMTKDSPMLIIVHNPQKEPKLSPKSMQNREVVEEYAKNLINGMPAEQENKFDYSYFARLRCYPDCIVRAGLPNVANAEEDEAAVQNLTSGRCVVERIDQVAKAIEIFKRDPTRRSVVLHTWIPKRDLEKFTPERRTTSSPCLVLIHPQIVEGKLHFFVVMKTNDLFNAWPGNAFAFVALQEHMAEKIGIDVGTYNHFSVSMQIYEDMYEQARAIK